MPFWRRRADLESELRSHLEMAARERIERGEAPEQAAEAARREFGNVALVQDVTGDQWSWRWLDELARDLAYGWRSLCRNPGYALVAIAAFALAIGANTAIYSLADAIYFRPLPYVPHEERLVALPAFYPQGGNDWLLTPANFRSLQAVTAARGGSFAAVAGVMEKPVNLIGGIPERLNAAFVSEGFFRTLGVGPILGRAFSAQEEESGHNVAILGYGLWQRRFGGNAAILGQTIQLEGKPFTVIGVMGRAFNFPPDDDIWLPLGFSALDWSDAHTEEIQVFARLCPGVALARAQAELKVLSSGLPTNPQGKRPLISAWRMNDVINGTLTPVFMDTLLGAMGFLLLLACANVANLNLARASARQREMALRAALGAGRGRMRRQLLTEALLLASLGAVVGIGLAVVSLRLLVAALPPVDRAHIAGIGGRGVSGHALLFTLLICLVAGLLSGLAPALRAARSQPHDALRAAGAGGAGRDARRLRNVLIGAQAALALVLLVGSGLMVTGFYNLTAATGKFAPRGVLAMEASLPASRYATLAQRSALYDRVLARMSATPGVSSACLFSAPPFTNNGVDWVRYQIAGAAPPPRPPGAVVQVVSPGFFADLRLPLRSGRDFTAADSAASPPVAIVSEKFARHAWPGKNPIGRLIRMPPGPSGAWLTVVGVAGDVEYDWTDNAPEPVIYRPYRQAAAAQPFLAARTAVPPVTLAATVRTEVAAIDPDLPLMQMQTLAAVIYGGLAPLYLLGDLIAALGLIALVLAAAGIYGVTAYSASRRTQEIGVRLACGAQRRDVIGLMVRQGMAVVLIGMAVGAVGAVLFTRVAAGFFFGVSAGDPGPFVAVVVLLLVAALAACYIPARRAARLDPTAALRCE